MGNILRKINRNKIKSECKKLGIKPNRIYADKDYSNKKTGWEIAEKNIYGGIKDGKS